MYEPCALIQDLLPLYRDGVCSDESRKAVEAHLKGCPACQAALAAMGAEIEGDRLGLGTNLFSGAETLTEYFGVEEVNLKLMANSRFMEERANIKDPVSSSEE